MTPHPPATSPATMCVLLAALVSMLVVLPGNATAQQTFRPADPIASIDGEPILLGELNYLLASKLRVKDLSSVNIDVQRASSALLVKQHLAMQSLRRQGGESLQTLLDRDWDRFVEEIGRTGLELDQFCKQNLSNEKSVRHARDWDVAWRSYLKSKMTVANLRRFYEMHAEKYASAAWEVSHIFVPIEQGNADSAEIAEQRIEQVVEHLNAAGQSAPELARRFAEMAIRESDGATAKQGGKIGWVSKPGDLPEAVMDAVRLTETGSVSTPIRTPLGQHLVLVHDKSVKKIPFEQLSDQSALRRDAAGALFEALVQANPDAKVTWYIKPLRPPSQ